MLTSRSNRSRESGGDTDLFAGTHYRTVSRIGAGGMGEVFVVEHLELGRDFVAKVLHAEFASDPRVVDRMRVERQSLGRLSHPHIVSVVDSGTLKDGRPFFVMERLRGRTLAEELRERGKLPVYEAVRFTCELLSALAAVLPDAPAAAPLPLALPTEVGVMLGTPRFASPEAAVGHRVDTRADLYGAALVLYLMLAGRGPFDHHAGAASVMAAHIRDDPAPPSDYAVEPIPYPLDQVVLRGLRKAPNERFQTASEFKTELESTVALLRKPLGWVETTVFPPEKPTAASPADTGLLDDTSRDGTTFQMHALAPADADSAPQAVARAAPGVRPRPFVVPFVLGMLLAGLIATGIALVAGR